MTAGESDRVTCIAASRYDAATRLFEAMQRPLVVSHTRPDGDALGALLAVAAVSRHRGHQPCALLFDPVPTDLAFLPGVDQLAIVESVAQVALDTVDGVIIVDTGAYTQLDPLAAWLRASAVPRIVVDHHLTRDVPATIDLVDESAAAASLIVVDWATHAGWWDAPDLALPLFVGLATDTGWFRYSNTSPACLRAAADLLERGVDLDDVHQRLFWQASASRLRCRAGGLGTLELLHAEQLAVMSVTPEVLAAADAGVDDTSELVNAPMCVGTVEVSVLLVETQDGMIKCSLRSKGMVDVARVAAGLGGGGHARAAGVRLDGPLDVAKAALVARLTAALDAV